jgi:hypothetical protein
VVAFVALFALLNVLVAAGQTGGDTIFSNLFLSIPALGAGAAALTAGAFAAFAVVRRRERSVLVLAAMIFGLLVLVFVAGEVAASH